MFKMPANITVQEDLYDCKKQFCYDWGPAGLHKFPCPAGITGFGGQGACRAIKDRQRDLLRTAKIPERWIHEISEKRRELYFENAGYSEKGFAMIAPWLGDGHGYIIFGPPSSGKTSTLCDVLAVALESGSALYLSYLQFVTDLDLLQAQEKASWLYWLETVDVLGIDGIANYGTLPRQMAFFWRILETRLHNERPTIITTGMSKNEIKAFFPPVFLEKIRRNSKQICLSEICEEVL